MFTDFSMVNHHFAPPFGEYLFFFQPPFPSKSTLPETNSSHLKMDGWNTILSFWDGLFSGAMFVPLPATAANEGL